MRLPIVLLSFFVVALAVVAFLCIGESTETDRGKGLGLQPQRQDQALLSSGDESALSEDGALDALVESEQKTLDELPGARQAITEDAERKSKNWIVRGRATLGYEDPAPGSRVLLTIFAGMRESDVAVFERLLVCDADGQFSCPLEQPEGAVTVSVAPVPAAQGEESKFSAYGDSLSVPLGGEAPAELTVRYFPLNISVFGVVTDHGGEPIENASVRRFDEDQLTGADGMFRFLASSLSRRMVLYASAKGHVQKRIIIQTQGLQGDLQSDIQLGTSVQARGRVVDERGLPVSGAEVSSFYTNENFAISGFDGRFVLDHLEPARDEHLVYARKPGYVQASLRIASSDLSDRESEFVLKRGTRVEGLVLDPTGEPLAGAELFIGFSQFAFDAVEAVSAADGSFEFPSVAPGSQSLTAAYLGFAPVTRELEIPPAASTIPSIVIQLAEGHFLAGTVTDPEGVPLEGISIHGKLGDEYTDAETKTDSQGRFRIEGLPEMGVGLELYGPDLVREELLIEVLDRGDLAIVMRRAGKIGGRVIDALTEEPLHEFSIRFVQPQLEPGDARNGAYSVIWVREGKRFSGTDGHWDSGDEEISPGAIIGVEIRAAGHATTSFAHVRFQAHYDSSLRVFALQPGAGVSGWVVDQDGSAVGGCTITLRKEGSSFRPVYGAQYESGITRTDEHGFFVVEDAEAGSSVLMVSPPGRTPLLDGPFEALAGKVIERTIRLPITGRIEGRVLGLNGAAEQGVQIKLFASGVVGESGFSMQEVTDERGQFVFDGLGSGRYQLSKMLQRGRRTIPEQTIRCDLDEGAVSMVVMQPTGPGSILGSIEYEGLPIAGDAYVQASYLGDLEGNPAGVNDFEVSRSTISNGADFQLSGLALGRYSIVVSWYEKTWRLGGSSEAQASEKNPVEVLVSLARQTD